MPNTIIPRGRWKKEVSANRPEFMYSPEHMNNQITPEEYAMDRFSETSGNTLLEANGTIAKNAIWERLRDTITGDYVDSGGESRLQNIASNVLGGFFASSELDEIIKKKRNGFNAEGTQQQPVLTGMAANIQKLKYGGNVPAQDNSPVNFQNQNTFEQVLQQKKAQQRQPQQVSANKIKASREQLKSLLANGGKANTVPNPYRKTK